MNGLFTSESVGGWLEERLRTQIVHFEYRKKDGSLREAWGTACPEIIGQLETQRERKNPDRERREIPDYVHYYDITFDGNGQRTGWRMFHRNKVTKIID